MGFKSLQKCVNRSYLPLADSVESTVSRVENGHTVPAVETLEKMARALDPELPTRANGHKASEWGDVGRDFRFLNKLCRLLAAMNDGDRQLLMSLAENVTKKKRRATAKN